MQTCDMSGRWYIWLGSNLLKFADPLCLPPAARGVDTTLSNHLIFFGATLPGLFPLVGRHYAKGVGYKVTLPLNLHVFGLRALLP